MQIIRWILSAALGLGVVIALAAVPSDPSQQFFDQTLGDLREELKTAKQQGKQGVMLFFEMDECPFCQRMKATVLNQPEVQAFYRQHFISLPIDIEGDLELTDFAGKVRTQKDFATQAHRVRATPVIIFFDLAGKPVMRYTGATSGVKEFLMLGEYVVSGAYLTPGLDFSRYKQQKSQGCG